MFDSSTRLDALQYARSLSGINDPHDLIAAAKEIEAFIRSGNDESASTGKIDFDAKLRQNPARNDVLPFGALPGCHFGRVLFLPQTEDLQGRPIAPKLLLLGDCDGSAASFLESVVDTAGEGRRPAPPGTPACGPRPGHALSVVRSTAMRFPPRGPLR